MPMSKGAQLFRRWRKKTKQLTQHECAKIFDVEITRISKYENGKHLPDRQMAVWIEKITCGAVTCGMWDEDPYPAYMLDEDITPNFDPLTAPRDY